MRLKPGDDIVLATHNAGKLQEMQSLLHPYGITLVSAAALNLPEPEETGTTFSENAALKAVAAAQASHLPALADDSGLCVDALEGAPGVYSARWAGPDKNFTLAFARLEHELVQRQIKNARAHFVSVLAFARPGGEVHVFEGRVTGTLVFPPRGKGGFGYDPLFQPDGHSNTFAQMPAETKQALSHRARAVAAFAETLLPDGRTV